MPVPGDGPCIGVLGAGQLARMLALAGAPLGMRFVQLAPGQDSASPLIETIDAGFDDAAALHVFAARADVVTFESENVPVETVRRLTQWTRTAPAPEALAAASDRWAEKALFDRLGIPTARWAAVGAAQDLPAAVAHVGLPLVLKTQRLGYDGRGQRVCRTAADLDGAWDALGRVPLLCEALVEFSRELSVIGVRALSGDMRFYPLAENRHENGILRWSHAPAPGLSAQSEATARDYGRRIAEAFTYVGVLALELFETHDGRLLANEFAPRVHNTGHWTIEGAQTSQFENHLRAIAGWPLGGTLPYGRWIMINLIGHVPRMHDLLAVEGTHVHIYGKAPRTGRKLGHVTFAAADELDARRRIADLRTLTDEPNGG